MSRHAYINHVSHNGLTRLQSLHGEVFPHRFWDLVAVFPSLDALLSKVFNFRSSANPVSQLLPQLTLG